MDYSCYKFFSSYSLEIVITQLSWRFTSVMLGFSYCYLKVPTGYKKYKNYQLSKHSAGEISPAIKFNFIIA